MIKKLVLKNWRSHKKSEFNFQKGTNVLVGPMGAGKSSVVNAICFSLFGTFPALHRKETTLDSIVMNKPFEAEKTVTTLEFEWRKKNYSVERIIFKGKKSNQAKLYREQKLIAGPQVSMVNKRIQELIETDYELFARAVFSEQNGLDQFLKLSPQQRKEAFDKILALDKYEKARKNSVTIQNLLKKSVENYKELLKSIDLKNLEKQKKELLKQITKTKQEINSLTKKKQETSSKIQETSTKLKKLETQKELFTKTKQEITKNKALIEHLEREITNMLKKLKNKFKTKSFKETQKRLSETEKELKKTEEKIEKQSILKAKIEQQKKALTEKEIEVKKAKKLLPENINTLEKAKKNAELLNKQFIEVQEQTVTQKEQENNLLKQKTVIEKKNALLENQLKELKQVEKQLKKEKGFCPVCNKALTEQEKQLLLKQKTSEKLKTIQGMEQTKKELETVSKQIFETTNKTRLLNEQEKQIIQKLSKIEEAINKLKDLKEKENSIKKQKKELVSFTEEKGLNQKKQVLQEEVLFLRSAVSTLKKEKEKKEIQNKVVALKKQLKKTGFKEKEFYETKTMLETQLQEKNFCEKQLQEKKIVLNEKKEFLSETNKQIENAKTAKKKLENLEAKTRDLKLFISALKQTQAMLRHTLIESGNNAMRLVWSHVYPYTDYKTAKIEIEKGEYHVKAKNRLGKWVEVNETLSGGERAAVALTLRISFSLVLASHLGILFLDEPTHNLDEKGVESIAETMREKLPGLINQIFLITHHNELEKAASKIVFRLERNKAEDQPTKIITVKKS